jgi:hypothetical protein
VTHDAMTGYKGPEGTFFSNFTNIKIEDLI